ncbi:META domain-containing protein [Flavobacterium terrigena]|uniref:Heat shock protein HslJ n=1 Tax=Flavobacterium terrigena TaxID=402734 RepID=A0A1H6V0E5_9FLAO|nr:META domain-containing protein [Flavobacterium terrigena]SEI94110.1 Heat shock protein HslJ [Flavobacterium terrigena]
MNKLIYLGILLFTLFSCKTASISTNNNTNSNTKITNDSGIIPYFKASGTEPFWSILISDDKIVYKTPEDSIFMPHSKPILAMDSNVKMYKIKTESAQFNIQISQKECVNQMSGEVSPYTVSVEFKKNAASKFEKIDGCGHYITDYRLHDIWVLEELNGEKANKENFNTILPLIEIYSNTNKFSGLLGCNRTNGAIFFEKGKLRFINIASTKMSCGENNKEPELIKALESVTTYSIGENRLILSNPSGKKIIFKKVD